MSGTNKKLPIVFFKLGSGKEPVREWLKSLVKKDCRTIGEDLQTLEYGWPRGMPLCRSMGDGLFEVRSNLSSERIARIIFCIYQSRMVLLHGFIKKTQKTSSPDLQLARRRKRELEK